MSGKYMVEYRSVSSTNFSMSCNGGMMEIEANDEEDAKERFKQLKPDSCIVGIEEKEEGNLNV